MGIPLEDARELAQQAFVIAIARWHEAPTSRRRRRAWLDGITWRLGKNFLRLRRHRYEKLGHPRFTRVPIPGAGLENRTHAAHLLRAALEGMTDEDHALFVAHFAEGATIDALSRRLGIPRKRLFRRLAALGRVARARIERLSSR